MSRMDRYQNIHKKAKPIKEKSSPLLSWRRASKKQAESEEEASPSYEQTYDERPSDSRYSTPYEEHVHSGQQPQKKGLFKKKQPKDPRKKRSWWKIIVGILLFLFVFSLISFFVGKFVAENDQSLEPATSETFNGTQSTSGAHNILILGSDTRGEDAGRADTIMVLQLDGPARKPKLISFMRDSFVTIPGVGDNKINAAYAYGGAELVRQTLLENFGLNCQYYMKVDFKSFEKVIDAMFMNGVSIDAEKDLNLDGVDIAKGKQRMDGHVLLQYARFRMDEEGDFGRVRRQQQVMDAIFGQLKNPLNLIRAPYAAGKAIGYTSTDVPMTFLVKNSFSILRGAGGIDRLSVPADNTWSYGQSDYAGSILVLDKQMNREKIEQFLSK
ncbi:LCP family protein [Enterococcus mundtii]|uniref:LCP family protein n=1 Tax=Enterococcus TaxID=1350 RepID=UPI00044C2681|nr:MULTISPECIES: LCP family protein [Enterococcus]AZP92815.1 Cro/Cl family transcriptional regulator [Enterococcus mundtii]EYT96144.1 Cro/Cl family transcriptional regulator [Enterococcus mundtii CRL35]MDA9428969.1 Cell envelope-associated transcriptional attenuator LytR-CpsA-Psr, subfamily A1 [Enterococcus mundtii 1A]MDK4212040.1 LCP family protein [Enterococcus mundtii]MDO7879652.1 LCP family protein [Enterococcus mundtii]